MSAVGAEGRGESSWLGWLLLGTIDAFAPCAMQRGEAERAQRWRNYADDLRVALERAWDGQWYRRGYYDDGMPLGSHENDERSEEHTSELQSLMCISYAVFCSKKKTL